MEKLPPGGGGGSFFPSNEIIAATISLTSLHTPAPCTTYHTKFNIQLRVLLRGALNSLPERSIKYPRELAIPEVIYSDLHNEQIYKNTGEVLTTHMAEICMEHTIIIFQLIVSKDLETQMNK